MLRFRFLGFPIFIEPWFWLTAAMLSGAYFLKDVHGLTIVLLKMAVIFISILGHELGHALTIRKFGAESIIYLEAFGGLCISPQRASTRWRNILISAAGPAVGFLLAGIFWVLATFFFTEIMSVSKPLASAVLTGLYINVVWSLFNLLPVLPMDGGQIFRELMGPQRLRLVYIICGITAVLTAVAAFHYGYWIAAAFLAFMAFQNFRGTPPPGGVETSGPGAGRTS